MLKAMCLRTSIRNFIWSRCRSSCCRSVQVMLCLQQSTTPTQIDEYLAKGSMFPTDVVNLSQAVLHAFTMEEQRPADSSQMMVPRIISAWEH